MWRDRWKPEVPRDSWRHTHTGVTPQGLVRPEWPSPQTLTRVCSEPEKQEINFFLKSRPTEATGRPKTMTLKETWLSLHCDTERCRQSSGHREGPSPHWWPPQHRSAHLRGCCPAPTHTRCPECLAQLRTLGDEQARDWLALSPCGGHWRLSGSRSEQEVGTVGTGFSGSTQAMAGQGQAPVTPPGDSRLGTLSVVKGLSSGQDCCGHLPGANVPAALSGRGLLPRAAGHTKLKGHVTQTTSLTKPWAGRWAAHQGPTWEGGRRSHSSSD